MSPTKMTTKFVVGAIAASLLLVGASPLRAEPARKAGSVSAAAKPQGQVPTPAPVPAHAAATPAPATATTPAPTPGPKVTVRKGRGSF
jgi:pyruvate dehydrogenase E2 component (dihydrolipoamide acetyltransferase)